MATTDLGQLLEESGAILRGHFILASGRHSDVYFEKFRVLERPDVLSALCTEIAAHFAESFGGDPFDAVAGPTTGGIIIAFEVARQMRLPAIYVEKEGGVRTLRRGKTLPNSPRILVVDDVLTTGGSLKETAEALRLAGGRPEGFAVLIDRALVHPDLGAPIFAAHKVQGDTWAEHELPEALKSIPPIKPGTTA